MRRKKRPKMHAARNIFTPGATPLWTAFGRPKFFAVAPGVTIRMYAAVLAACIQRSKQS